MSAQSPYSKMTASPKKVDGKFTDIFYRDVWPTNPNKNKGVLEGADYTFLDGRPTPYGARAVRRMEKQQQYTVRSSVVINPIVFSSIESFTYFSFFFKRIYYFFQAQIIRQTREVDMARATHKRVITEKEQEIKQILDSKLKPKGTKLLES